MSFLRANREYILLSLFFTLVINSFVIYFFIKYGEPIYFHYDEIIWVKQVGFCGGEFAFYEQKWGLIVPLLCLLYPLKLFVDPYYFSILRVFLIFIDCLLLLKLLDIIFGSRSASLFVFFFHFSNIFSVARFFVSDLDETFTIANIYGNSLRIFNPSLFQIFFLLFCLFFVRFLNKEHSGLILKNEDRKDKNKLKVLSGIFLGLLFYSIVYWWQYAYLSVFLVFVIAILLRKEWGDILYILILSLLIGFPVLSFNYFQIDLLGDSLNRAMMLVKSERILPDIPSEFIFLLVISVFSFIFFGNFSLKYLFVILSVFSGFILFFQTFVTGIHMQIVDHVTVQFKLFSKIAIGLTIDKIAGKFRYISKIISLFMFLVFLINWSIFFYLLKDFSPNKKFNSIIDWVKKNSQENSVITMEDEYGFFPILDVFPTASELIISVATGRYVLHNNINYFSDLSDNDVFERFLVRAKLLGYTWNELKSYVEDISKRTYVVGFGWSSLWSSRAYFGLPQNFNIMEYKDIQSALADLLDLMEKMYSDEFYMSYLMKKFKIDIVVRKKPRLESESYLRELGKIEEFFVFKVEK